MPMSHAWIALLTVADGQSWRAILDATEELGADLSMMGSHGYHGLDRVLGTTAAKVANLSPRHVFVVHHPIGARAGGTTGIFQSAT
jgi:nucleotide-binding universal stress UspA family protein